MRRELPAWAGLVLMGWLTVVLWLDRAGGGGGLWQQRGLGAADLAGAAGRAARVSPLVRAQTLVVVAFATVVEYVFSPTLEVYTYRFHNVPAFVPAGARPGLPLGARAGPRGVRRAAPPYGGRGGARRPAAPGRRTACCSPTARTCSARSGSSAWSAFLLLGPSQPVYVGAFVAVSWLELAGTHLGTWAWGSRTTRPAGCRSATRRRARPGGYGWFDLAGLLAAPSCSRLCGAGQSGVGAGDPRRRPPTCAEVVQRPVPARRHVGVVLVVGQRAEERQRLVVQPAVAGQRVAAGGPGRAVERGEHAAGLADDHVERGHVVELELRLGGEVDGALGEQHVGPEVAVRPGPPAAPGQRQERVEPVRARPSRRTRSRTARRRRAGTRRRRGTREALSSDWPVQAPPSLRRPPAALQHAARTRTPTTTSSSTISAISVAHTGHAADEVLGAVDRVDHPAALAVPGRARSPRRARRRAAGPGTGCAGCPPRRTCRRRSPGVRSGLFTTCRSSALNRLVVSESASSARTWASRRSSVKVVGMGHRLCPAGARTGGRPGRGTGAPGVEPRWALRPAGGTV